MEEGDTTTVSCTHHWIIQSPNGPTATGECAKCHKVKQFSTTMPTITYYKGNKQKPAK